MLQLPKEGWLRALVLVAIAIAAGYILWRLQLLLGTVLLAVILTYVLRPPVEWLSRLRVPRTIATLLVFVVVGMALWWLVSAIAPAIGHDASRLQASWEQALTKIPVLAERAQHFYQETIPATWRQSIDAELAKLRAWAVSQVKGAIPAALHSVWVLVELLLVPVLAFYFLSDTPAVRECCLFFLPPSYRPRCESLLRETDQVFDRYIQGQLILCLVAFLVVWLGLRALHMEFALTLGLVAGLTRAIPIVGPIFGGIPIVALGLAKSPTLGLWLLAAFALMHFFESKYLMPKILGFKLGVHPVVIIVSLLVGAEFFGIIGMFLAAPVVAVAQRLISRSRQEAAPAAES